MCRTADCCGVILAILVLTDLTLVDCASLVLWKLLLQLLRHILLVCRAKARKSTDSRYVFFWSLGIPLTVMGTIFAFTFNYTCLMAILAHLRAAFTNPGLIDKKGVPPEELDPSRVKHCKKCDNAWKPERAHHCSECNSCVFKMDHHCPWVNNCVGARNMKYFFLFVLYTGISAAYSCIIMFLCFYNLMTAKSKVHMQKPVTKRLYIGVRDRFYHVCLLFHWRRSVHLLLLRVGPRINRVNCR